MAQVSSTDLLTTSILHVKWKWQSNANPWVRVKSKKWRAYSDVETAIIEEAYQKKLPNVLLDKHSIDFEQFIQISNNNIQKQRRVKRLVNEGQNEYVKLRKKRFLPNPIQTSSPFAGLSQHSFLEEILERFNDRRADPNSLPELVERAAQGLIIEAKKDSVQKQGEWMAEQLFKVKDRTRDEVWRCCARLYCMESFLYYKLNECMRLVIDPQKEQIWKDKVNTLGPFARLLHRLKWAPLQQNKFTVYRGALLSKEAIEQYAQKTLEDQTRIKFPSFTSTSRSQAKAEQYGNMLFEIEIRDQDGYDVAPYSNFDEEEYLLHPDLHLDVTSCVYNVNSAK